MHPDRFLSTNHDLTGTPAPAESDVIEATKTWLEKAVIGLNLCPFAKAVHRKKQIRYVVSTADTPDALALQLAEELTFLHDCDPQVVDTTLLIHPSTLTEFVAYNTFLAVADQVADRLGLRGEIQIASFHPDYEFADCTADAIENFTNRSPYPILHLLREASIDIAVAAFPDASEIYQHNIETLRTLGHEGWRLLGVAPQSRKTKP